MSALPAAYSHWLDQTRRLLEPLAALMHPGRADLPIVGPASDHDAQADRLESFTRPLILAAHFLQAAERPADIPLRARLSTWFLEALVAGSDPRSPHYFGPDASYHQHHVEMGLLSIALQIAPAQLWAPLATAEKDQVATWLGTSRGSGIVNNNHLFMSVHILEFLGKHGYAHRTDRTVIAAHLNQLETMHRGGGWFEDGINQAFDHYNAYAFHFYGLWWTRLHGRNDPARAARWRDWARQFVNDYHHFFAASGEHPAFGRSIMYRFNALAVFGLASAENCTDVPAGQLRRLCTRNLDFFASKLITQEQGCLAFGWTDRFDAIAESYSCAASPYWCAKGLSPLLLPPDHAFWNAPEEPLACERGDFVHPIPAAGLVVRGVRGAVEILNAGSMVGNTQLRYGAWKWSKLAYRTGVSFTLAEGDFATNWSADSALTQQLDDGRVFGRHSTVTIELDRDHIGYSYNLGFKTGQINTGVETFVWWRAGWLLHVHLINARQPAVFRLGGFSLPLSSPDVLRSTDTSTLFAWSPDGRGTVLQSLAGFTTAGWDARLTDATPRTHIAAPYHATPVLTTERLTGPLVLVALSWSGRDRDEATPWSLLTASSENWTIVHPKFGQWTINHWSLPAQPS